MINTQQTREEMAIANTAKTFDSFVTFVHSGTSCSDLFNKTNREWKFRIDDLYTLCRLSIASFVLAGLCSNEYHKPKILIPLHVYDKRPDMLVKRIRIVIL